MHNKKFNIPIIDTFKILVFTRRYNILRAQPSELDGFTKLRRGIIYLYPIGHGARPRTFLNWHVEDQVDTTRMFTLYSNITPLFYFFYFQVILFPASIR